MLMCTKYLDHSNAVKFLLFESGAIDMHKGVFFDKWHAEKNAKTQRFVNALDIAILDFFPVV